MIGIIGGAGPLASALLYQLVVEESYLNQEGVLPEILLLNHSFPRGLTLEESSLNQTRLEEELQACIQLLVQAGASRVCIACNTLHGFLRKPFQSEMILLPERVVGSLRKNNIKKVGVLSTETTRHSSLYKTEGIAFCYPTVKEQKMLNPVFDRILEGKVLREDSELISTLMIRMKEDQSVEGVILACTDLSVLNHRYPLQTPGIALFDSLRILARELFFYK
jgi:aspartate racemase